jgi:acyl-CoA synthetase (AMP-forming)/AMP-acid ligase II
MSNFSLLAAVDRVGRSHGGATAIVDDAGRHTYADLAAKSAAVSKALRGLDVDGENVAYLCRNDADYAFTTFGIW